MAEDATPQTLIERYPDLVFDRVEGSDSWYGVDEHGQVQVTACSRRYEPDPSRIAQDMIETGSQVVGEDDESA